MPAPLAAWRAVLLTLPSLLLPLEGADSLLSPVEPDQLNGLVFQLTVATKGKKLPLAASGASLSGWVLSFDNGRAVLSIPNGGEARCHFTATSGTDTVFLKEGAPQDLPRAQLLVPEAQRHSVGFVSVNLKLNGQITDHGRAFTGHLTWVEKDDKNGGKVEYILSGQPPGPAPKH